MPNNKETSLDAVRSITRPSGPSAHLKPTSKIARQALRARGPRAGTRRRNKVASQSGFMMPCAKLMLRWPVAITALLALALSAASATAADPAAAAAKPRPQRSEEHTSELQSRVDLVCRLLLEKKKVRRHAPDR